MNPWVRLLLRIGAAAAAYALSAELGAAAVTRWAHIPCRATFVTIGCTLPSDSVYDGKAYLALLAIVAAIWIGVRVRLRTAAAYPFVALIGTLLVGALLYDMVAQRPLLSAERTTNETFNVLRFGLFTSFALTFVVAMKLRMAFWRVGLAIAGSFAAAILLMICFLLIQPSVIGATELSIMFIIYAFGAAMIHLMLIAYLIATAERR